MLTRRPWFESRFGGPNGRGWGWKPVSPEGWGVTVVAGIALFIVGRELGAKTLAGQSVAIGIIAVLALVSYLTGGTPDETP